MSEPNLGPDSGVSVSDGFRVNFSDKEASSEGRGVDLLPRGNYHVKVTDGSIEQSKSEKNFGKPYYNLELTIQSGPHAGRKLFTNAMLFEGALYTITQIMKAMGINVTPGEMIVPTIDEIVGHDFVVGVIKQGKRTVGDQEYDERNDVKGFMTYTPDFSPAGLNAGGSGSKKSSLMP